MPVDPQDYSVGPFVPGTTATNIKGSRVTLSDLIKAIDDHSDGTDDQDDAAVT